MTERATLAHGPLTVTCVVPDDDDRAIVGLSLALDQAITVFLAASALDYRTLVFTGTRADLILIGGSLSGHNLADLIRDVRDGDRAAGPPVIVLTNDQRWRDQSLLDDHGVIGVIGAPFDPFTLADAVRGFWRNRGVSVSVF